MNEPQTAEGARAVDRRGGEPEEEEQRRQYRQAAMEQWLLQQEEEEENAQSEEDIVGGVIPRWNNDDNDVTGDGNDGTLAVPAEHTTNTEEEDPLWPGPERGDEHPPERAAEDPPLQLPPHPPHPPFSTTTTTTRPTAPPFWLFRYRPASVAAFFGLIWYALRTRQQYYLAVVYLCRSKWSYIVIGNAILASTLTIFDATVQLFLRGLRGSEAEGLSDFFRWNVTETCLALTMFRHELTLGRSLQFVALIALKCWHFVAAQREQNLRMTQDAILERFPYLCANHARVILFLWILQGVDIFVVQQAVAELLETGPTVQILFAFEAAILLVSAWSHMILWYLHVVDSMIQYGHEHEWRFTSKLLHPWKDYKATLTFAVELQAQAINFLFYSTFFAIVLTFYGMPLNLFREVYMSLAKLKERLTAFFNYRHLMASMNRFENATDADLDEGGRTCIICRDEMCTTDCKRLPVCGHTFHKSCLREWLVQQQSCPTCRSDIAAMEAQEAARKATANAAAQRATTAADGANPNNPIVEASSATVSTESQRVEGMRTMESTIGNEDPTELSNAPRNTTNAGSTRYDPVIDNGDALKMSEPAMEHMCPALYQVVEDLNVFDLKNRTTVTRTLPIGCIVLCLGRQRRPCSDSIQEESACWLRIPDGWIPKNSVKCLCAVQCPTSE